MRGRGRGRGRGSGRGVSSVRGAIGGRGGTSRGRGRGVSGRGGLVPVLTPRPRGAMGGRGASRGRGAIGGRGGTSRGRGRGVSERGGLPPGRGGSSTRGRGGRGRGGRGRGGGVKAVKPDHPPPLLSPQQVVVDQLDAVGGNIVDAQQPLTAAAAVAPAATKQRFSDEAAATTTLPSDDVNAAGELAPPVPPRTLAAQPAAPLLPRTLTAQPAAPLAPQLPTTAALRSSSTGSTGTTATAMAPPGFFFNETPEAKRTIAAPLLLTKETAPQRLYRREADGYDMPAAAPLSRLEASKRASKLSRFAASDHSTDRESREAAQRSRGYFYSSLLALVDRDRFNQIYAS